MSTAEHQESADDGDGHGGGSLGWLAKLLILAASLAAASIAGAYVHPHLLPLATERAPQLWRAIRGWMTPPVLFLLLNMMVGTLYVSSSRMCKDRSEEQGRTAVDAAAAEAPSPDTAMAPASTTAPAPGPAGLRARLGSSSRTLTRLVRSKSEQIPAFFSKADRGAAGRLKKAGTFETAGPRPKLKPVVVVADPPDDAPAGHEEVDQQAEAFISRFYHKVKLQRLDSLLRQQQQQQQR